MSDEIDRLEIVVEAEAKRANRALGGMEKRLNRIADSLEKVTTLTAGINGFDKFDTSGLGKFKQELDSIFKSSNKRSVKVDDSDLKYAKKSMQELQKQFADSKLEVDVSVMGENELKRFLSQTERRYSRLKQSLSDAIELNGSDVIGGKAWYRANMQVMQYENAINEATKALGRMKSTRNTIPEIPINRGVSYNNEMVEPEQPRIVEIGNYEKYDSSGIEEYINNFAGATKEANTFEAQIKRLKTELSELASQGYSQYDPEYDAIARELAEVTEAQKQYNKELRQSAKENLGIENVKKASSSMKDATKQAGFFKRAINGIKDSSKRVNSIKREFDNVGKSIRNVIKLANGVMHPLRTLKNVISGENSSRKGMSWGRMIGSSVLFSFVFQGISAIQNAIKEGSDNLVQYSSEYNRSISSMVSSLLYLKNAWAAAFSPIANVVAPYISKFVDMMASALNTVGRFMAALTGKGFAVQAKKVWQDYGAGLDSVGSGANDAASGINNAAKAAKNFKNYTLGIDELNVIDSNNGNSSSAPSSGGSGSGTSGISASDMFETVEVSSSMNKLAEMFKKAMKDADFTGIGRIISNKLSDELESINWNSIYKKAGKFGKGLATFLNGLITPRLFYNLGKTVANSINTAFHAGNAFAINFDWKNLGKSLARSLKGFFENWDAGLTAETLSNFGKGILQSLASAIESLGDDDTFEDIGQDLVDLICNIDWGGLVWELGGLFKAFADAMYEFPQDLAKGIAESIVGKILGVDDVKIKTPKWFENLSKYLFTAPIPGANILAWLPKPEDVQSRLKDIKKKITSFRDDATKTFNDLCNNIKTTFVNIPKWFGDKFTSAYNSVKTAFKSIDTWFKEKWAAVKKVFADVKGFFEDAFGKAYKAVKSSFDGIGKVFKGVANDIISPIGKAVNGIISGVNWVLDKLGSNKNFSKWEVPKFAGGTNGLPKDTFGMVNDQKGSTYRELIVPPNGHPFIPEGRNVMLPLEKGTKIMPAKQTKEFMNNMPHFAGGIGSFFGKAWSKLRDFTGDVFDYVSNPEKLMQIALDKFTNTSGWTGTIGDIAKGVINTTIGSATNYIKNLFGSSIMEKAIKWAVGIANDNSHGYDQAHRTGPDYDCSSLVTTALKKAGFKIGIGTTSTMFGQLKSAGFKNVAGSVNMGNASGMRRGDILLAPGKHTAIYLGGGKIVHARINEFGRVTGGKTGDQTGNEIAVTPYHNHPWTYVLRYSKAFRDGIGMISASDFIPALANGGILKSGQMFVARERGPELVGKYGSQSGVMNNDQIVSSVSDGVAKAVAQENEKTNALLAQILDYQARLLEKDNSTYLDSKKVDRQLKKKSERQGYQFSPA